MDVASAPLPFCRIILPNILELLGNSRTFALSSPQQEKMIDAIKDSITAMFPDLAQRGTWTGWLFGLLCSLLALRLKSLFAPDLLGHKWIQWIGITDIVLLIVLIYLEVNSWWYLLVFLPLVVFPVRVHTFWRKHKQLKLQSKNQDYDIARYQYLEWLESHQLFRWEIKIYYLPALNVLFEIGAMSRLENTLNRLEADYGNWYEWKRLKSYLYHNRQEYQKMIDLIRPYENMRSLSPKERHRTALNLFSAYRNTENREGYETYIQKIERLVFEQKLYTVEAFDDLIYHYEKTGNEDGIERLSSIIANIKVKSFSRYLDFQDLLYMHNQRLGNREANIKLLEQLRQEHHSRINDEGQRLRFDLRMLKLYFENNYHWQQYSCKIFDQADLYLSFSPQIALEYMEAVFLVIKNGDIVNMHIPTEKMHLLFQKINDRISSNLAAYDRRYTFLSDDFLYRKKEMLMHKVTLARIRANITNNIVSFVEEISRLLKQIIALCHKNGAYRERIHFQVVLADEMQATIDFINNSYLHGVHDTDILLAQQQIPLYTDEIRQQLTQIDQSLESGGYDRTQAYYILYSAYFHHRLGETQTAKIMLQKYEATGIDITNFTYAIQMMYAQMKGEIFEIDEQGKL